MHACINNHRRYVFSVHHKHLCQYPLSATLIFAPFYVLQESHHMNGSTGSESEHQSPASILGLVAVLTGAAAILFYIYRRRA